MTEPNYGSTEKTPDEQFPDIAVVTMRGSVSPQNATHLLLNVLSELTAVSLVTVKLAEESPIHDEYNVTEIARGSKADSLLKTALLFLQNQLRMCREIWRLDASLVYFFGATAYTVPILFAKLIGKTVVIQPRGDVPLTLQLEWEEQYPDAVARLLAGLVRTLEFTSALLSDRIVTYTQSMAEDLGLDCFGDKLYTRGTRYIKVDDFAPTTPYEHRERCIGLVARLDVEKGIEEVTKAVELLPNDIQFLLVGDGSRREWVERRLAEDIESGRVELTGWVDHDDIPEFLNRMRLFILASEPTEGLPTAIQEALACGTPVYATPVSGIPDVVRPGETGFLIEERTPEHMAAEIEEILDREDLQAMSENCREFAVENYRYEASVERFRELLRTV